MKRLIGVLVIITSLIYILISLRWRVMIDGNPGPALFPVILGVIALISGLMCAIEGVVLVGEKKELIHGLKWCGFFVVLCILFTVLLTYVGMAISCGLAFAAVLLVGGYRKKISVLVSSIAITVSIYLLFGMWLHTPNVWIP